jgi:hypothetical protein
MSPSKKLWHTIQIKVPAEMVELTKAGKVSVKKTLTKTLNISKSQKKPAIKLIPSDGNKVEIINDGKEWDIEELKKRMLKAKQLEKKNAKRNIFEPKEKRMINLNKFEGNIIKRARELGAIKKSKELIKQPDPEPDIINIPEEPKIKEPEKIINKLEDKIKEFEETGREYGAVIYDSSEIIQSTAYIALIMEYESKCAILNENIKPTEINSREKSPMNFNLYKQAEQISNDLLDCIKRGEKLIAIPLGLRFGTSRIGHANLLIYRPYNKTIERFEPHGKTFLGGGTDDNVFNRVLKRMFEKEMKPYLKEYTPKYIEPSEICPNPKGFQSLEGQIKKLSQEGGGFCGMWTLFVLELMFINPEKTTLDIINEAFIITKADPQYLSNVIRGYVLKIEKLLDNYIKKINSNDGFKFSKGKDLYSKKNLLQEQLLNLLLSYSSDNTNISKLKDITKKTKEKENKYTEFIKLLSTKQQSSINQAMKAITNKAFGVRTVNKMKVIDITNWIINNLLSIRPELEEKFFDYFGEKTGGAISTSDLKKFVDAGYKKKKDVKNIDGYVLDNELSTRRDKVYYDPKTNKAVHTIAGTDNLMDWTNNLLIPLGLHSKTNRYKNAEEIQKKANKKYGKQNVSVVSHSQSGNIADNLAKRDLVGDDNVTLNPAIIGKTKAKVVKSYFDPVSFFTKTKKDDVVLKPKSINIIKEHGTNILEGKGRKNKKKI